MEHLSGPIPSWNCGFFVSVFQDFELTFLHLYMNRNGIRSFFLIFYSSQHCTFPFPAAREGNTDDIANILSAPYAEGGFVRVVLRDLVQNDLQWQKIQKFQGHVGMPGVILGWKQTLLSVASFIYGIPTVIFFLRQESLLWIEAGPSTWVSTNSVMP